VDQKVAARWNFSNCVNGGGNSAVGPIEDDTDEVTRGGGMPSAVVAALRLEVFPCSARRTD